MTRTCKECEKDFDIPQWRINQGHGVFCSPSCAARNNGRSRRIYPKTIGHCPACGSNVIATRGSEESKVYCSLDCYKSSDKIKQTQYKDGHDALAGENSPHWKGGIIAYHSGYLRMRISKRRYKAAHRLVVEEMLGRELLPEEVVHHKSGDKKDNRIENLEVLTRSEHARLHHPYGVIRTK